MHRLRSWPVPAYNHVLMTAAPSIADFPHSHLLGIEGLSPGEITLLLDRADGYVALNRRADKKTAVLRGRTQINLFFESSTRTRTSFELAGKRRERRSPVGSKFYDAEIIDYH